jgi:NDP-sugar pyrophosphorylase family protein
MKYELTDDIIQHIGKPLHRIKALKSFADVKKGDLGGFIEKESNLSQEGDCWVFGYARVFDNAKVFGDAVVAGTAHVYDRARVCDNAIVYGDCRVYSDAKVFHNAHVYDSTLVFENATIHGNARVYGNTKVHGCAELYDNVKVYGNAKVFSNACLKGRVRVTEGRIKNNPINILGFNPTITITDEHIFLDYIISEAYTHNEWLEDTEQSDTHYKSIVDEIIKSKQKGETK